MSLRLLLLCTLALPLSISCTGNTECEEDLRGAPEPYPQAQRNPNTGLCQSYGGGGGGGGGDLCGDYDQYPAEDQAPIPDWGLCDGYCETLAESDCLAAAECRGSYRDTCAQDTACSPEFHQCWAITPTGPYVTDACGSFQAEECARHNECAAVHTWDGTTLGVFSFCADEPTSDINAGSCVGEVTCESLPPECPSNTVPGRKDGCWSGFCIPLDECDVIPGCELETEAGCINRDDCQALYEGLNCECTSASCVCESWLFEACQVQPSP